MSTTDREFDIVLFGATGFAGRLTAQHLATEAPAHVRIALAGRSRERLAAVAEELGDAAAGWPLIVLDATDDDAVADLAGRTRVVVTTVGPYMLYGRGLAAACAAAGTHYCDLTGEVLFVHQSIAENHEVAKRTGARIVHACGVDSIPSDLGVLLTARAAQADGAQLGSTRLAVKSFKGGASGGTVATLVAQADQMRSDARARSIVADRWALAEGGRPPRSTSPRTPGGSGAAGPGGPGGQGIAGEARRRQRALHRPLRHGRASTPASSRGRPRSWTTARASATSSTPTTAVGHEER